MRLNGYVLAPPGGRAGRFDLAGEPAAYLADSPETALYESLFRREVRSCPITRIEQRALVSFETRLPVRLVDLRGLEEQYPCCSPCAMTPARPLPRRVLAKRCTECSTRQPSTLVTAVLACSNRALNGPGKWR